MAGKDTEGTVTWLYRWNHRDEPAGSAGLYTIKDVGNACQLPGSVIMQLVPRTWTRLGWMYTSQQLAAAVRIAAGLRGALAGGTSPSALACSACGDESGDGCGDVVCAGRDLND